MNPLSDAVPSKGWLASRAHRRLLVIASYVSYVGGTGLLGSGLLRNEPLLLVALVMVVVGGGFVGLFWLWKLFPNRRARELDERQRGVRDRAYRVAYQWVVAVCFLLIVVDGFVFDVFDVLGDLGRRLISDKSLSGVVLCLLLFLPSSVAAWIEPDPP